ncbi:hypothetical protein BDZ89DRAFT_1146276 [Hymenopellis radicata]|nr:hypothetical protein BDZ89DRAFT_1146276 [Hymenopellis radicata]
MLTRLKLANLLTAFFGVKPNYTTKLKPGDNDAELKLSVSLLDVALLRHNDADQDYRSQDPVIQAILNDSDATTALAAGSNTASQAAASTSKRRSSSHVPLATKKPKTEPTVNVPPVSYAPKSRALPETPLNLEVPPTLSRQAGRSFRRRHRKIAKQEAQDEYLQAQDNLLAEDLPVTKTWWMGMPFSKTSHHLSGIRLVPYQGVATRLLDAAGRLIIYRSRITNNVRQLLPQFLAEARDFVRACGSMGEDAMQSNRRGSHWFCIAGVDRNNKTHRENAARLKKFFAKGTAFYAINLLANALLEQYFPGVA